MSISINSQTPGMINQAQDSQGQPARTNLMESAVQMARDGLDQAELDRLHDIAGSDGNVTGNEQLLLNTLEADRTGFSQAVQAASRQSGFDPSSFSWNAMDSLSVTSDQGHDITLQFSPNPSPAKEISGDIGEATRALEHQIPPDRLAAWQALDKHNVAGVGSFVDSLHLPLSQRAEFTHNYLTAYYNHPGVDISWGGASLQEGINTVPKDENGRAYLDCEAYVKTAEALLGSDQMKTYAVASGAEGERRDHQVAIRRDPHDAAHAYVISNNQVTRVDAGNRTPEQMIQSVYPEFHNIREDLNGAMKFDSSAYNVGQVLNTSDGGSIRIDSLDNATTMSGTTTYSDGSRYHVRLTINEDTGDYTYRPALQPRDVMFTDNGTQIRITAAGNPAQATAEKDGQSHRVRVSVGPNGEIGIE